MHGVSYSRHDKRGGLPSLKVTYSCGLKSYSEWVCFEHQGYARQKALEWWRKRAPGCPCRARRRCHRAGGTAGAAHAISVRPSGRFLEISGYRFDPCATSTPASAPSATGNLAGLAGSTRIHPSRTRGGTKAANTSASAPARTSAMGGQGMIDPTPNEMQAMSVGGQYGGEYLESIGKSDLATLTETEWDRFIDAVITGYCDQLRALCGQGPHTSRRHDPGGALLMAETSFMARFGARLVTNGYGILPIGPGTKKPGQFKRGHGRITRVEPAHRTPTTEVEVRHGRPGPSVASGLLAARLRRSISTSLRMRNWRSRSSNWRVNAGRYARAAHRQGPKTHADLSHSNPFRGIKTSSAGGALPRAAVRGLRQPPGHWRALCLARGGAG